MITCSGVRRSYDMPVTRSERPRSMSASAATSRSFSRAIAGNRMTNHEPRSCDLSTSIRPPWAATMVRALARSASLPRSCAGVPPRASTSSSSSLRRGPSWPIVRLSHSPSTAVRQRIKPPRRECLTAWLRMRPTPNSIWARSAQLSGRPGSRSRPVPSRLTAKAGWYWSRRSSTTLFSDAHWGSKWSVSASVVTRNPRRVPVPELTAFQVTCQAPRQCVCEQIV